MNNISSTYRFIALTLAFLMLFTSVGFAADMHYCQGQLKSFSFFGKAKICHEMTDATPMNNCQHNLKMMAQEEGCSEDINCCANKTFHFQLDQDQQVSSSDFVDNPQLQQFVIAYLAVRFINDFRIASDAASFTHYKPPLILKDIPVLIQSFLL